MGSQNSKFQVLANFSLGVGVVVGGYSWVLQTQSAEFWNSNFSLKGWGVGWGCRGSWIVKTQSSSFGQFFSWGGGGPHTGWLFFGSQTQSAEFWPIFHWGGWGGVGL